MAEWAHLEDTLSKLLYGFYFSYEILLLEELVFTTDIKTHIPLSNCWLNIITSSTPFCFQMSFTLNIMVGQAASRGGITEYDLGLDIG